ncbi:MAG: STAS domain-containing protein [Planctomycetes bacterium]|nr:STAS domain-containing protein [Planctomycetota bacterium]
MPLRFGERCEVVVERRPEATVVRVRGNLDSDSYRGVEGVLVGLLWGAAPRGGAPTGADVGESPLLVVDCADLDRLTSAGIGVLVAARKRCGDEGGELRLAAVSDPIRRTLETLQFAEYLPSFETVEQALSPTKE